MPGILSRMLLAVVLTGGLITIACEQDIREESTTIGRDVERESREAWAALRTNGERLIDDIQTRTDPEAKQRLLERCRDTEEALRRAGDANADRVNEFCDRVRATDVDNTSMWDEIERQFQDLKSRLGQ